jgi:hypothetical protein
LRDFVILPLHFSQFLDTLIKTLTHTYFIALPFKDAIPAWARPAVVTAWSKGIISGYPDGTFRPHNQITRAEMAVIVARALGLSGGSGPSFKDAAEIPAWAVEA